MIGKSKKDSSTEQEPIVPCFGPSRICTIVSYASPLIFFTINKAPAPSRAHTERKDQGRALTNAQPLFLSCLTAGQPQLDRLTYLGLEIAS
jgi:hypothetical protein